MTPLEAARASGLVREEAPLLVLLSGGADSVCLLDVSVRLGASVAALHVNYGLRPEAEADEELCRSLCERLGVPLSVERVQLGGGNLQAAARDARYALAEGLAAGDYAAAHTASDQAETVLYRLAVSPGRRALLGMEPRRGRLVRPLLTVRRADTREWCSSQGLPWHEDASNADARFARARVRHGLLDALRHVSPTAEMTIAETAAILREEEELLDAAASDALERLGGGPVVELAALRALPPALARLVLRSLAATVAGEARPLSRAQASAVLGLGRAGSSSLDLGDGLRAVAEYGTVRFRMGPDAAPPQPVALTVPGSARFGTWQVAAGPEPGDVCVSGLDGPVVVRSWREGDRMRPLGLGGSKALSDVFTDAKVPRALRRTLPVVESAGEIAWVAGVALDERFAAEEGAAGAMWLSARQVPRPG
jgi:tRNA(Ile)-lysidine synthase